MKLDVSCYGYAGFSKSAIFVVLFDDGLEKNHRVIPVTTKSSYNAELYAIKYAMLSVAEPAEVAVKFHITMKFIPSFFAKNETGGWAKKTDSNVIQWIREYSAKFAKFECTINSDIDRLASLKTIAQTSGIK